MSNPKVQSLLPFVKSGSTIIVGREDEESWKQAAQGVTFADEPVESAVIILAEVLQKTEDPVKLLKDMRQKTGKLLITVPNEWSWAEEYKPRANKAHLRFYDTESLARDLEEAGLSYVISLIDYSGWSFLLAQAT